MKIRQESKRGALGVLEGHYDEKEEEVRREWNAACWGRRRRAKKR